MPGLDMMPNRDDHEAAMARADLYKLANYSFKLFKMIQDGDQLEGWVQAKVTKAADYIASVYHFMEYEMKFSEYGEKLETSDVYTEEVRQQFKAKLMEAKVKLDKLKKKNEKEVAEDMKVGDKKKSSTGGTIEKTKSGVKHTAKDYDGEDHTEPAQKKASKKGLTGAERRDQKAGDKSAEKSGKDWEKRHGKGSVTRVKDGKKVDEASKPDFLDMDKDGDKKEPMKKAVADKKKKPFVKK
jgi:hypothetical protein